MMMATGFAMFRGGVSMKIDGVIWLRNDTLLKIFASIL